MEVCDGAIFVIVVARCARCAAVIGAATAARSGKRRRCRDGSL